MYINNFKWCLIVLFFLFGNIFAGGMPEFVIDSNGNKVNYWPDEPVVIENDARYQQLKRKYDAEVEYSEELRERIARLQVKDRVKQEEVKPEKEAKQEDSQLFNYIMIGVIGIVIGVFL